MDEPHGEYAEWVAEKAERRAAIKAYLDMLDAAEDKRHDMVMFMTIVIGLGRL